MVKKLPISYSSGLVRSVSHQNLWLLSKAEFHKTLLFKRTRYENGRSVTWQKGQMQSQDGVSIFPLVKLLVCCRASRSCAFWYLLTHACFSVFMSHLSHFSEGLLLCTATRFLY